MELLSHTFRRFNSSCVKTFPAKTPDAHTLKHIHFQGLLPYNEGSKIQEYLVRKSLERRNYQILKRNPRISARVGFPTTAPSAYYPTILSFEFEPIYTGGKREKKRIGSEKVMKMKQLKHVGYVQTNRGGQVTYHGPGQIVIYPIIDLADFKTLTSKCYVSLLENSVISLLCNSPFNLPAKKTENTGVWVDSKESYNDGTSVKKISSLGVNVRRSITSHGCSINCKTDLSYLNDPRFVMCGLSEFKQTSILNELGSFPSTLENVSDLFVNQFSSRLTIQNIDKYVIPINDISDNTMFNELDKICRIK